MDACRVPFRNVSLCAVGNPVSPAGIAQNFRDIERVVAYVDTNFSGGIDFDEFLAVLRPSDHRPAAANGEDVANAFAELRVRVNPSWARLVVCRALIAAVSCWPLPQKKLDSKDKAISLPLMMTIQVRS